MSPALLRELAAVLLKAAAELEAAPVATPADEWIDAKGAAAFGLGRKAFRAAIARGALPGSRVGRRLLTRRADLEAFVAARRVSPKAAPAPAAASAEPGAEAVRKLLDRGRLVGIDGGKKSGGPK